MITAVDTNVLLDIFGRDSRFCETSAEALRLCHKEGRLVVCDIVLAELAAVFLDPDLLKKQLESLSLSFQAVSEDAALLAGEMWRSYRKRGGTRERLVADFLVAAHAQAQCDRLLSRDRGFYRKHFPRLRLLDPAAP